MPVLWWCNRLPVWAVVVQQAPRLGVPGRQRPSVGLAPPRLATLWMLTFLFLANEKQKVNIHTVFTTVSKSFKTTKFSHVLRS